MDLNKIPFIGIVAVDGYVESYNFATAKSNDFHHSFCLSDRGLDAYDDDDNTLRFIRYQEDDYYTLEGLTSLDPYGKGHRQIKIFAQHCIQRGTSAKTMIKVAQQHMNSEYEGQFIGTLRDWA